MNKKIKVIELFNMIANGNIPKMIMRCYEEYKWDESSGEYRRVEDKRRFSDEWVIESILNDEVEILEDEEEIDIQKLELFEEEYIKARDISMTETELDLIFKTNDIIKYLQQLDKKINKED